MKQTAVDWLLQNIPNLSNYIPVGVSLELQAKFDKTKEMEKEQMRGASCPYIGGWEEGEFEDWYNETYNKDESNTRI